MNMFYYLTKETESNTINVHRLAWPSLKCILNMNIITTASTQCHPPIVCNYLNGAGQIQRAKHRICRYAQHDITIVHIFIGHSCFFTSKQKGNVKMVNLLLLVNTVFVVVVCNVIKYCFKVHSRLDVFSHFSFSIHIYRHSRSANQAATLYRLGQSTMHLCISYNVICATGSVLGLFAL